MYYRAKSPVLSPNREGDLKRSRSRFLAVLPNSASDLLIKGYKWRPGDSELLDQQLARITDEWAMQAARTTNGELHTSWVLRYQLHHRTKSPQWHVLFFYFASSASRVRLNKIVQFVAVRYEGSEESCTSLFILV